MTSEWLKRLEERIAKREADEEAERMVAAKEAAVKQSQKDLVVKLLAVVAPVSEIRQERPGISDNDLKSERIRRLRMLLASLPRQTVDRLVAELPNCKESDLYFAILGDMDEAKLFSLYSEDTLQLAYQLVINHLNENEASVSREQFAPDLNEALRATPTPPPLAVPSSAKAAHSPDFRSVNWFGTVYEFTPNQAACVKLMWEASENGTPSVGDQTILVAADSNSERLSLVFRDHAAWSTLIVEGQTKGTHRLADPPTP